MNEHDTIVAGHLQEVKRGSVVIASLAVLRRPHYGYSLLGILERGGIEVDGNTLYPLLRRLEKQGLLTSAWNTDDPRPRKFYHTSPLGRQVLEVLAAEWSQLGRDLQRLLQEEER